MASAFPLVPAAALADHVVTLLALVAVALGGPPAAIRRAALALAYRTAATLLAWPLLSGKVQDLPA